MSMRSSASAICAVRADRRACAADGERADDDAQLVVRVGATSLGGRDRLDPRDAAERSGLGELLGHDLARQARRFRQLRNGKSSSAASVLRPAASPTASRCSGRPTAATSSAGKGLPVQPHLPLTDQPAVRADREARRGRKRRLDARLLVVCDGDQVLGTSSRRATAASSPAGTHCDANRSTGSLILKLDGGGAVQWQTLLRPLERTYAYLYAVQPTADGGYVAAGTFYPLSDTGTGAGVVAVKVDANGKVHWHAASTASTRVARRPRARTSSRSSRPPTAGYLLAGTWGGDATVHGEFRQGPLLLKLDANGSSKWQKPYSAGNLLWQHFYYETYPSTGRTLSQYFASSAVTSDGGHLAVGFTENPSDFAGELFAVRTDSAGLVGGCNQTHPATPVTVVDPGLATINPGFRPDDGAGAGQSACPDASHVDQHHDRRGC